MIFEPGVECLVECLVGIECLVHRRGLQAASGIAVRARDAGASDRANLEEDAAAVAAEGTVPECWKRPSGATTHHSGKQR